MGLHEGPVKRRKRTKEQEHRTKVQRQKAPAAREITLWTSRDSRTTTRPPRTGIHTARQATAKRHSFLLYTVPFQTLRPISPGPPAFQNSRPLWRMFAPVSQRTCKHSFVFLRRQEAKGRTCIPHQRFRHDFTRQAVFCPTHSCQCPFLLLYNSQHSATVKTTLAFLLSTLIFLNQPVLFAALPPPV